MKEQYIYEGIILYNIKGQEIIVDSLEWNGDNTGYIYGRLHSNQMDKDQELKTFAINSLGSFLFYEKEDIFMKDDLEFLKSNKKYAEFSKIVKESEKKIDEQQDNSSLLSRGKYEKFKIKKDTFEPEHKVCEINKLHNYLQSNYNFEGFIHTTDFSNFINIMKSGYIYSRYNAVEKGLIQIDSADKEVLNGTNDFVKGHVRFYFRDKTPTHYNNEGIKPGYPEHHMAIPVILIASRDLYNKYSLKFTNGNAGRRDLNIHINLNIVKNYDWNTIFSRGYFNSRDDEHHDYIKKSRNAEILIPNEVSLDVINKIIFRSEADLKMANILFGNDNRFFVDENKFFNEHQYCKNYIIELDENNINFAFQLNLSDEINISKYSHILKCCYYGLEIQYDILNSKLGHIIINRPYSILGKIEDVNIKFLEKIEYLINGHVSAIWRRKND